MKLIAKYNVQVRGHIYAKGEAMEWDGPLTPRIIANFTAEDGSSPVATDAAQETPPHPPPDGQDNPQPPTPGELPLDPPPDGQDNPHPPTPGELPLDPPPDGQDNPHPPTPGELPLDPPPDGVDEDALVKRTLDALKREGVMRQLDEMGVTYQANAKSTFLARLLLMSKGEIKCGE